MMKMPAGVIWTRAAAGSQQEPVPARPNRGALLLIELEAQTLPEQ